MFKNVRKEEITIPAQMSYLVQIRDFVENIGRKHKFSDKVVNSFKLVIDEACTNLIRHGYRDIKNGEITIIAIIRRSSLTIIIIDQGQSYDPRRANTPDLAKYIDIGKKGGLGILMMRKLMDDLQYTVTDRGNEFRLTKFRDTTDESKIMKQWRSFSMRVKYSLVASFIFTTLSAIIFTGLFLNIDRDIQKDIFTIAASSCRSLADNAIDGLQNEENNVDLFINSLSVKQNQNRIISEAFITNADKKIEARDNPGRSDSLGVYKIPENAVLIDSIQGVLIHAYTLDDTIGIFDLSAEIHQTLSGEGALLGYAHVWVEKQIIIDICYDKKLQLSIFMAVILIIGYLLTFFLINRIIMPFQNLAEWVRQVVHGKITQDEIDIDASDELGEIAQAFNEMTEKFREAQVGLIEQQKLQKELQVAQEIQQMLLPSDFPKVEGYEIASYYEAAKEVGGDLFDFVEVDEDTIGICVADVSGKGVPGSLIMTMIRTALRLESRGNKNPADVLARVNRFVVDDMRRGMFVTMFYIILDSRNRIIHYASAGHNPMMLYRGSTKQTYYLNPSGFPVGIQLPDVELFARKIETDSIRLQEDDILVLYTDGITEAMNANRELYREERFLNSIRSNAHLDVGEFIKSINVELKNFTGGALQNDDITFVSIKEKLMHGDVIYRVQEQLKELIAGGTPVKKALEQLRVSPHYYYKYKDIIDRKGMGALKKFLKGQDYIEKKHISIEVKTKIFDIIRKHPDYGAKRIANELKTEEYGSIKIDSGRLYNELVNLRLNTQELRERFIEKGGKKRLKQPGTPLLTLDGNVILDFESSEKEIKKRGSAEFESRLKPISTREPDSKKAIIRQTTVAAGTEIKSETEVKKAPPTIIHKQAKPLQAAAEVRETKPPEKEDKTEISKKTAPVKEKPIEQKILKKEEAKPVKEELELVQPKTAFSKEEVLDQVSIKIDENKLDKLYKLLDDDLKALELLEKDVEFDSDLKENVKKINLILKIILTHPILKELTDIKQIISQIHQAMTFINENFEQLDKRLILLKVKQLLKYLKKDHKLSKYSIIIEAINEIGLAQHHLTENISVKKVKETNEMDRIRKKLLQKKIITRKSLVESLTRDEAK
jgi:serine phosphatase RsbU (regulator of sigma subunit)/anti-sigma regulatory factor (Ser/Thr protein kinase)